MMRLSDVDTSLSISGKQFLDVPSTGGSICDAEVLKINASLIFSCVAQAEHAFDTMFSTFRLKCIVLDMHKCAMVDASGLRH